jgi:hypothetical protein
VVGRERSLIVVHRLLYPLIVLNTLSHGLVVQLRLLGQHALGHLLVHLGDHSISPSVKGHLPLACRVIEGDHFRRSDCLGVFGLLSLGDAEQFLQKFFV